MKILRGACALLFAVLLATLWMPMAATALEVGQSALDLPAFDVQDNLTITELTVVEVSQIATVSIRNTAARSWSIPTSTMDRADGLFNRPGGYEVLLNFGAMRTR